MRKGHALQWPPRAPHWRFATNERVPQRLASLERIIFLLRLGRRTAVGRSQLQKAY